MDLLFIKSLFKRLSLCCVLIFISIGLAYASDEEYKIKAALVYNFLDFTEWPKSAGKSRAICVVGENDPVLPYVAAINEQKGNAGKIEVQAIGRDARVDDCNIVYVGVINKRDIDFIIGKTAGLPILSVSDDKKFTKKGGIASVALVGGEVKLGANLKSMRESGLIIDSEVLELMDIIR